MLIAPFPPNWGMTFGAATKSPGLISSAGLRTQLLPLPQEDAVARGHFDLPAKMGLDFQQPVLEGMADHRPDWPEASFFGLKIETQDFVVLEKPLPPRCTHR